MIGKLEDTLSAMGESMAVRLDKIEHRLDSLHRMVSLKTSAQIMCLESSSFIYTCFGLIQSQSSFQCTLEK